jgi:hypothetical protein
MKKLIPRFKQTDPVPSDPLRVLSGRFETPGEIHKRTGLDLKKLCESLILWHQSGAIMHAEIRTNHCTIPVFKIKTLFDF